MNEQLSGYHIDDSTEEIDIFDIDLTDSQIIQAVKKRVDLAKSKWNKDENLDEIRENNFKYWRGKQWDERRLYRYNVPYVDNRILPAVESIIAHVTSRVPTAEVFPANNEETSIHFAEDLEVALQQEADRQNYRVYSRSAVRNLLMRRLGMLKIIYNSDTNQIETVSVNPENLIIDYDARMGENPSFIAEKMTDTIQELCAKFPDKKQDLYEQYGIKRGTVAQVTQRVEYQEVWFTYFDKDSNKQEGVVWLVGNIVLDKQRNPNWIYKKDMEKSREANFLDYPEKPYIPYNYLNDGESYIDQTSVTEQAISQQDIVNVHGRQITENANRANPQKVFSGQALTKSEVEELTGDPNESIVVNAENVRDAVTTIVTPSLPAYVQQNMMASKANIDSMFGTFNVFRGEQSNNNTLGQDVMIRNQAVSRQDDIVRAIDVAAEKYYRYLAQMMKVYWDEDHWYQVRGEDGKFDFVVCNADNIEPSARIVVKAGSTLPIDKERIQTVSLALAKMGMIDPMSLYEDLDLPNPSKRFERFVKYKVDQTQLLETIKKDEYDAEAFRDIITMNGKMEAEPRNNVTEAHLAYHRKYMMSGEFRELDEEIKQMHIDHMTLETEHLRQQLLAEETQLPSDQDFEGAMQREALMAQLAGQGQAPQNPQQAPGAPQGQKPPQPTGGNAQLPPGLPGAPQQSPRAAAMGSIPQNAPLPPINSPRGIQSI